MAKQTLNDLLEIAINDEISSQRFYRESVDKTPDQKVKRFLESLVAEEKQHERILESLKEMDVYDGSVEVKPEILKGAAGSHDIKIPSLSQDASMEEIFEVALKRESKAIGLYRKMAAASESDEVKALFENLADEEMTHHRKIEQDYHAATGQMGRED